MECSQCSQRAKKGHTRCPYHLEYARKHEAARREKQKRLGLCYFPGCKEKPRVGVYCFGHWTYRQFKKAVKS